MTPEEFARFISEHNGRAQVKTAKSLESARALEAEGIVEESGRIKDIVVFDLTPRGAAFIKYAEKQLGTSKAKRTLKSLMGAFQDYAQAYKQEHPVGMKDIANVAKGFGSNEESEVGSMDFPGLGRKASERALPSTKKLKLPKYIEVDGKLYKEQK